LLIGDSGLPMGGTVGLGEGDGDGEGVGEGEGDGVGVGEGEGDGVGVGVSTGDGLGVSTTGVGVGSSARTPGARAGATPIASTMSRSSAASVRRGTVMAGTP
jgi:hypothetical protein